MSLCLECPAGRMEADEVVAAILGLGSPAYRYVFDLPYKTWSYLLKRNVDHRACIP